MKSEPTRAFSKVLVFAYGSNMCTQQMIERCPSAEVMGVGVLRGHKLIFPRWSNRWQGGVVSVARADEDSNVEGIVWKMSAADLIQLDRYEGFKMERPADKNSYNRVTLKVNLLPNKDIPCEVYIAADQGNYSPSQAYLEQIQRGRELIRCLKIG